MDPALVEAVSSNLHRVGYAYLDHQLTADEFQEISEGLGTVWDSTSVRIVPRSERLYSSISGVPFHTDSPFANVIAWHCIEECNARTPTMLLRIGDLFEALNSESIRLLSELKYDSPIASEEKIGACGPQPIIRVVEGEIRLNYMAWMPVSYPTERHRTAMHSITNFINRRVDQGIAISLAQGQALFLDNTQFLHARPKLPLSTLRHLHRLWINTDNFAGLAE